MSISLIQQPLILQPVNNPIPIVVSSTSANDVGYRYKLLLPITGNTDYITFWIYPDPTNSNYMIFDVSQILSDHIGSDNYWNSGLTFWNDDIVEYGFAVLGYIGDTFIDMLSGSTIYKAFRGVKQYGDYWDPDDYMMDKTPNLGQFLTKWKEDRYYKIEEYATLKAFIGRFDETYISSWDRALFNVYDINGSVNQYAFYPTGNTEMYNDDYYGIYTIPFGPANLNIVGNTPTVYGLYLYSGGTWVSFNGTPIDENTHRYSITLQYSGSSWTDSSETLWVYIDNDFYRHQGVEFMWLGELGNYETYTFRWLDVKTNKIDRDEIRKNPYSFENNIYSYKIGNRGRDVVNIKNGETHTCYSDWVSSETSRNLMELYSSPIVYIIEDNEIYPVIIETKDIEEKIEKNNHLFNLKIEFSMAYEKLSNL